MLDEYRDFCPLVQKYLSLAPQGEILECVIGAGSVSADVRLGGSCGQSPRLCDHADLARLHAPLKTWVDGRVALIGDAVRQRAVYGV